MERYRMIMVAGYLLMMSIMDLKVKRISYAASTVCFIAIVSSFIFEIIKGRMPDLFSLAGVLLGVALILLSKLTDGSIGMGDGIVFCLTGMVLGLAGNFSLLCTSLLLAGILSIVLICTRMIKKSDSIPFVPFVFLAFGGMWLYGI